jgi:hypothetical protein
MAAWQVMDSAPSRPSMQRTQHTKRPATSLVANKIGEINALTRSIAGPLTDATMNVRLEELFAATVSLTHFPAASFADLDHKLDILCRRLREFLDPDDRGATLTYLLAQAIREEVQTLSTLAAPRAGSPLANPD